ncbi:MAG: lysophospholipid acyltransferase family protein [Paludibacteraceae bacterium]
MYNVVYYILKLLSYLPFWLLYLVSDFIYLIVYHIVRYRVNVVRENINRSFPEKTVREKKQIEKKFYHHFGDMMVEMLKMMSLSDEEVLKRMKYIDYEPVIKHYEEGRSVILYTSHFGNWEWLSSFSLHLPKDKPVYQVYKKLSSDLSNKISFKTRQRFGAVNVEMKELLRKIVELKKENKLGMFGMISDQSPRRVPDLHFVDFLHQPTSVITGSEQLAKKFNFPVYFVSIRQVKRGYYTATLQPLALQPTETAEYEITTKYMELLEKDIRRQPEQWLWSHKRWKHKPKND